MKATIDRIEGDVAVLIALEGEPVQFPIPRALLPEGCREGDVVTLGITRDEAGTTAAKNRVAGRIARLTAKRRDLT